MIETIATLLTAIGLGSGAGVNAYATFLVFGLVSRLQPALFPSDLAGFFGSTPVLIVAGTLYVIEFIADKIPAIDHAWDVVHTFIRPLAGALLAVAATSSEFPRSWVVVASVLSGGAALGSHLLKATMRAASTTTTGGMGNPILSVAEDIVAFVSSAVAIFLPWLFLALLIVAIACLVYLSARWSARREG
ncbi:MAG TPA: DUF4126 domain-containing protein [Thermoanaerobaculia bacterium]|nr:DUF4126 domain-containing protein [Thermoanaerobaculia bacterium]